MAVPKSKCSRRRRDNRRSSRKIKAPELAECPKCHSHRESHKACPNCGYYNENVSVELRKNREKKKNE